MEKLTFNKNGQWTLSKSNVFNLSDYKKKETKNSTPDKNMSDDTASRRKARAKDNERVKQMYDIKTKTPITPTQDPSFSLKQDSSDEDSSPDVDHKAIKNLIDGYGPSSPYHELMHVSASNHKDTHPDDISRLIDMHGSGTPHHDSIHYNIANNPSTKIQDLHKLMKMHDKDSKIYKAALANLNKRTMELKQD
jgi:hypothetical protein